MSILERTVRDAIATYKDMISDAPNDEAEANLRQRLAEAEGLLAYICHPAIEIGDGEAYEYVFDCSYVRMLGGGDVEENRREKLSFECRSIADAINRLSSYIAISSHRAPQFYVNCIDVCPVVSKGDNNG